MSSFLNAHTRNDLERLRQFLSETLIQCGATFSSGNNGDVQLLNLACGRADETRILADVFGQHADSIHLTGIDIRNKEIGEARERWRQLQDNSSAEFFVQDASQLD